MALLPRRTKEAAIVNLRFSASNLIWGGVFVFLFLRLINILGLPIFTDEAIYLHWGQIFTDNSSRWLTSVVIDGKQPGWFLLLGIVQFLPLHPLLLGRLLSVLFSSLTYFLTIKIFRKIFPERDLSYIIFLLIFTPYLIFFDRTALQDSALTAFYIASFYVNMLLLEKPTFRRGLLSGLVIAGGWWIKSTILLAAMPLTISLFDRLKEQEIKRWKYFFSIASMVICFLVLIAPLVFQPSFSAIFFKEQERVYSLAEFISSPMSILTDNLLRVLSWWSIYLTPFITICFLAGSYFLIKNKKGRILLLWIFIPVIVEILMTKYFTSRYLLMVVPVILIVASEGWFYINKMWKGFSYITIPAVVTVSMIIIFSPLVFYERLIFLPHAKYDFTQYVTGWTSGFGVAEAADFIIKHTEGKPVYVYVRSDSGNPEDAMYVLLRRQKNIKVNPIDFYKLKLGVTEIELQESKLYFVSRGNQLADMEKYLKPLAQFRKPIGEEFIGVYEIIE